MKKLLIIPSLLIILVIISTGSAFAGIHGGYDNFTDACAGCHRAHTAAGSNLIKRATQYELCLSCHGNGGISRLNVLMGWNTDTTVRLNGGGFQFLSSDAIPPQPVTSAHTVDGLPIAGDGRETGVAKAWGSGGSDGTGVEGILECGSCHNPHGSKNYRALRDDINDGTTEADTPPGWDKWVPYNTDLLNWTDVDMAQDGSPKAVLAGKGYTALAAPDDLGMISLGRGTSGYGTRYGNYYQGMIRFCATCHKQYWTASGSGEVNSSSTTAYLYPGTQTWAGDTLGNTYRFRHAVSMPYGAATSLPMRFSLDDWTPEELDAKTAIDPSAPYSRKGVTCLTCHFAHGTSAAASGYSLQVPSGDSALLYYSQRGTCMACHGATKSK